MRSVGRVVVVASQVTGVGGRLALIIRSRKQEVVSCQVCASSSSMAR